MEDPFLFRHTNATELFLIRHGDAIPDEEEIIPSGIYDDLPLSRIGREQAQQGKALDASAVALPARAQHKGAAPIVSR